MHLFRQIADDEARLREVVLDIGDHDALCLVDNLVRVLESLWDEVVQLQVVVVVVMESSSRKFLEGLVGVVGYGHESRQNLLLPMASS